MMEKLSKDFRKNEFACPCCGFFIHQPKLIKKLQKLRDKVGLPIRVNSGTRCLKHNLEEGGSDNSAHLSGHATDITCDDMFKLLKEAFRIFDRIGIISSTAIHVDVDPTKKQKCWWPY